MYFKRLFLQPNILLVHIFKVCQLTYNAFETLCYDSFLAVGNSTWSLDRCSLAFCRRNSSTCDVIRDRR